MPISSTEKVFLSIGYQIFSPKNMPTNIKTACKKRLKCVRVKSRYKSGEYMKFIAYIGYRLNRTDGTRGKRSIESFLKITSRDTEFSRDY
jgi:hypothetical protein